MAFVYRDAMSADGQVTAEEMVAAIIFEHPDIEVSEGVAQELGREIVLRLLADFRPDLAMEVDDSHDEVVEVQLYRIGFDSERWSDEPATVHQMLAGTKIVRVTAYTNARHRAVSVVALLAELERHGWPVGRVVDLTDDSSSSLEVEVWLNTDEVTMLRTIFESEINEELLSIHLISGPVCPHCGERDRFSVPETVASSADIDRDDDGTFSYGPDGSEPNLDTAESFTDVLGRTKLTCRACWRDFYAEVTIV